MSDPKDSRRTIDLVCLGRAAVDLYGEQLGSPLEDIQSFAKSLGGCAANIAVGAARQGLRVAMLTRVGDEHMGRFVRAALAAEGVDVTHVKTDPERLTGLVLLAVRDRHTFPLIFYRERCADMGLVAEDVDPELIGAARALLVTGTHFSQPGVDRASRAAITYARRAGTKVVLDLDYRPVLWGLTGPGAGEERFLPSSRVTEHLLSVVADCDLVVGTEEELHVAGGTTDTLAALRVLRGRSAATIVLKRGPLGCVVFEGAIPERVEDGLVGRGVAVDVLNVLGAGDAFLAGFLRGWLRGEPLAACTLYANACGALVVSRHGCAPAMPTAVELDAYVARAGAIPRIDLDPELSRLHRVTTRRGVWPELCVLAFDHRLALEKVADRVGAPLSRLSVLKRLLAVAARRGAERAGLERAGMIIDDRYGQEALDLATGTGWWLARPIERPSERGPELGESTIDLAPGAGTAGSPLLDLEGGPSFELTVRTWPVEHVVKCLVYYHPDHPEPIRRAQEDRLERLQHAVEVLERELLLEIIPIRGNAADPASLPRALRRLYHRGVRPDWWKLPPPADAGTWRDLAAVIEGEDPHCRGVLLLGLDAPEAELARGFELAGDFEVCRGFAVGRTIFGRPSERWLEGQLDDEALIEAVATRFQRMIALWRARRSERRAGGRG